MNENTAAAFFNGSHVVFVSNSASTGGGGIACSDSELRAEHLFFTHNTAGEVGGGIGALNCRVQLTSANFMNNSASYGGAVAARNVDMDLNNITVMGNSNGAIDASDSQMAIRATALRGNHGDVGGGIIAVNYIVSLVEYTLFESNKAVAGGGAISGFNSQVVVSGVTTFTNNDAEVVVPSLQQTRVHPE